MRYLPPSESESRTLSNSYYGGEAGVDVHLSKSFDLEFGARYMSLDASNTRNGIKYRFDNMITGYGSIIYRFKMD
jgi:asparagine N-glycosylation enzyme membrane subunit Stt3